jgi:hypothetical protein
MRLQSQENAFMIPLLPATKLPLLPSNAPVNPLHDSYNSLQFQKLSEADTNWSESYEALALQGKKSSPAIPCALVDLRD